MRYEISQFECRSSTFAVLCKLIGTRNAQAHDATLESTEKSCAVFEDTRTMDSTLQRCREPTSLLDTFAAADWARTKPYQKLYLVCRIRCQIVTQSAPVLFSVEAEYLDIVKGASIGITMQSMARNFGDERMFQNCNRLAVHRRVLRQDLDWKRIHRSRQQVCYGYNTIYNEKSYN